MRFTRDWGYKYPIHCCLWDRSCLTDHRLYQMPLRLHLHFLKRKNGNPVYVTLWGGRALKRRIDDFIEVVPPRKVD